MNDRFDSSSKEPPQIPPEALKKKKLWRNLFILNLCITIFLIGLYWLPVKLEQMGGFLDSPSMKDKKSGPARKFGGPRTAVAVNPNLLPTSTIVIDATNEEQWTYFDSLLTGKTG